MRHFFIIFFIISVNCYNRTEHKLYVAEKNYNLKHNFTLDPTPFSQSQEYKDITFNLEGVQVVDSDYVAPESVAQVDQYEQKNDDEEKQNQKAKENSQKINDKQKLLPEVRFESIATDTSAKVKNQAKMKQEDEISVNEYTYEFLGRDWPGQCSSGTRQSPINIYDGLNTVEDNEAFLDFAYLIDNDFSSLFEKIFWNGKTLVLKANIGEIIFSHADGTKEYYKAEKIMLHYPAEHRVTMFGQTPRYSLELQIYHKFIRSTDPAVTNEQMKIHTAVVSILFKDSSILPGGDEFLSRLGIGPKELQTTGFPWPVEQNEYIDMFQHIPSGMQKTGFNIDALENLRKIINQDHHIYRYYGSETKPPCLEGVHWFVFARPRLDHLKFYRSISDTQVKFLRAQVMKQKSGVDEESMDKYYGNNRMTKTYDDSSNGKIFSMPYGIGKILGVDEAKV